HELMARLKLQTAALLETSTLKDAGNDPQKRLTACLTVGATLAAWLEPHGGLLALAGARSAEDVFRDWTARIWPGSIAGDLLCYMLQMETSGISPSVNKALAIESDYLKEAKTGTGQPGPRSERYLRQSWEEFKPAAHLWLAFRAWQFNDEDTPAHQPGPRWFSPLDVETLRSFLAVAERFAKEITVRPQGRRKPPIDPADFWRVPESIALPAVTFKRPALEPWGIELLKSYKRKV
ncbi:MAG TPA: hypothetical protein VKU44_04035, partial [Terriglobia bacterium]|nr:hypothetical protein [Terriglobia bacterium]